VAREVIGAAVLSVGDELLRGDITDTNAVFLSRALSDLGFDVRRLGAVGDDLDSIATVLRQTLNVARVVIITGGLGPTEDDLTRQGIAAVLGETPEVDETLLAGIRARFTAMGRPMTANNAQQALLIPSATAIPNPDGTAPGWLIQGDHAIAALPGPPSEMRPMWADTVRPALEGLLPTRVAMIALMTFGVGESVVAERIAEIIHADPDVTVATYARAAGVEVHITARGATDAEADRRAGEAAQAVRQALGEAVYGEGNVTLADVIGGCLAKDRASVATMESATGGMLSNLITNTDGSSQYFRGGIVAYSREAKAAHGVPAEIMDAHGLISPETAVAMAGAARRRFGAEIGLATTGIAGSDAVESHPPGTAFVAVDCGGRIRTRELHRPGSRETAKMYFAQSALDLLRLELHRKASP